jgi:predicted dehydrogenase
LKIKTVIIGLGQIGQGYDYDLSYEKYILTHCQAIQAHPNLELVAGIDISHENRKKFKKKFNVPSFVEISDLTCIEDVDLVVVATPTEAHLGIVKKIVSILSPKLILIEKPLSILFEEAQEIIRIGKEKRVPIAVNYIREYEPIHRELFEKIKNNELGNPLKVVCWYSKGIINNGSHFVQLLSNFMGSVLDINIINDGRKWNEVDPEPVLEIIYQNGRTYFIPVEEENYSLFEMEVVGSKGKIKYYNGGSHYDLWHVNTDPVFKNYKKLEAEPITSKTDLNKYQYYVYNNIAEYFEGNSNLYCDGKSALKTAQILDQIQQKID